MLQRIPWLVAALLLAGAASASSDEQPPLFAIEARISGGMALGGGAGKAVERVSPLSIGFLGELTLESEIRLTLVLGLYYEGVDRAAVGGIAGVRVHPHDGPFRFGAGLLGTFAPYTIMGADLSGGYCYSAGKKKTTHLCGDLEADLFFIGNDLPDHRVAAQLVLGFGVNFDVY